MRISGTLLALVGIVTLVAGLFLGLGALFSWNGRHLVEVRPLTPGTPLVHRLAAESGRRYTLAAQVVFDRTSVRRLEDGHADVSAKMPVVARALDERGAVLTETVGWLDPEEPPTMLFGVRGETELVAERIVGSFSTSSTAPIELRLDLGEDRVGAARITEARLVVYDDATPPGIRRMLLTAAAGGIALAVGTAMLVLGFFRRRSRRGGIRPRKIV